MRKARLSLPMERWRRYPVRRLVELREISVSLEMRRQRTSFGGESEYLDLHFSCNRWDFGFIRLLILDGILI